MLNEAKKRLEAARQAALLADGKARHQMANPDKVRTLFFWGFEVDIKRLNRSIESLNRSFPGDKKLSVVDAKGRTSFRAGAQTTSVTIHHPFVNVKEHLKLSRPWREIKPVMEKIVVFHPELSGRELKTEQEVDRLLIDLRERLLAQLKNDVRIRLVLGAVARNPKWRLAVVVGCPAGLPQGSPTQVGSRHPCPRHHRPRHQCVTDSLNPLGSWGPESLRL